MSERRTGATSAQIEAAAIVEYELFNEGVAPSWGRTTAATRTRWIERSAEYASALVDAEHRIVSVDDLRVISQPSKHSSPDLGEALDRIAALLGPADE